MEEANLTLQVLVGTFMSVGIVVLGANEIESGYDLTVIVFKSCC
jgi:hypothetical protein